MEKYLPIGSVVLLEGAKKRVMIFGRGQRVAGDEREWDYVGCPYPEGNIGEKYTYLFDHDQIHEVHFVGYRDAEGLAFDERMSEFSLATEAESK